MFNYCSNVNVLLQFLKDFVWEKAELIWMEHDVATKVEDYNKTGGVPRPQPQAVTEHMMQLGEQMSIGN